MATGGVPKWLRKARVNAASVLKPTSFAKRVMLKALLFSILAAYTSPTSRGNAQAAIPFILRPFWIVVAAHVHRQYARKGCKYGPAQARIAREVKINRVVTPSPPKRTCRGPGRTSTTKSSGGAGRNRPRMT